ncbi:MAG: DUF3313 domain-containing protein [Gammaproteobacteria bacterium]|nr:DUF3313 domain-containing protein [Gammaproteobacteria bacterium]
MKNAVTGFSTVFLACMVLFLAGCASTDNLATTRSYQQGFLSDYTLLKPRGANDWVYISPDAKSLLAASTGVLIDQPEIHISPSSPYSGAKPSTLTAIAEAMRSDLSESLKNGGYNVVTEPGPNILILRLALTDIYLQEKERNLLEYTPIGFVVGAGISAMQSVMEKVDILAMTFQVEVTESSSKKMLAELVAQRGGKQERITFEEFQGQMRAWGERLSCNISNARLPASQQTDCVKASNTD